MKYIFFLKSIHLLNTLNNPKPIKPNEINSNIVNIVENDILYCLKNKSFIIQSIWFWSNHLVLLSPFQYYQEKAVYRFVERWYMYLCNIYIENIYGNRTVDSWINVQSLYKQNFITDWQKLYVNLIKTVYEIIRFLEISKSFWI